MFFGCLPCCGIGGCYAKTEGVCWGDVTASLWLSSTTGGPFDTSFQGGLQIDRPIPLVDAEERTSGGNSWCLFQFAMASPTPINCGQSSSLFATRLSFSLGYYKDGTTNNYANSGQGSIRLTAGTELCGNVSALQFQALSPGLGRKTFSIQVTDSLGAVIGQLNFIAEFKAAAFPYVDFSCFELSPPDGSWARYAGPYASESDCEDVCGTCTIPQPSLDTEIRLSVNEFGSISRYSEPLFGCLAGEDLNILMNCSDQDLLDSLPSFQYFFDDWVRCTLADQADCQALPGVLFDRPAVYFGMSSEDFDDTAERFSNWISGGHAAAGRLGISCDAVSSENAILDLDIYSDLYSVPNCFRTDYIAANGYTVLGVFYILKIDGYPDPFTATIPTVGAARLLYGEYVPIGLGKLTVESRLLLENTSLPESDPCRVTEVGAFNTTATDAYFTGHNPLP